MYVPKHSCHIAGHIIEPLVWDAIVDLLKQPEQIARAWEAQTRHKPSSPDELD